MISSGQLFVIGVLLVVAACALIVVAKHANEGRQIVEGLSSVLYMAGVAAILIAELLL